MGESTIAATRTVDAVTELWLSKQEVRDLLHCGDWKIEDLVKKRSLVKRVEERGKNGKSYDEPMYSEESVRAYLAGEPPPQKPQLPLPSRVQLELPAPADEDNGVDLDAIPRYAYLTVREAATLIRMPQRFIREACKSGRLAYELGEFGSIRVKRADIEDLPARRVKE
jgi:hypothetical protein